MLRKGEEIVVDMTMDKAKKNVKDVGGVVDTKDFVVVEGVAHEQDKEVVEQCLTMWLQGKQMLMMAVWMTFLSSHQVPRWTKLASWFGGH